LEPTVGIYGVEGSKPGAAAAAVFLAHKVIRPTKKGYGKILGECVWVSKRLYCRLLTMADRGPQPPHFRIALLQMLPAERDGFGAVAINEERAMAASFVGLKDAQLKARLESEPKAMALFKELGSDQVILAYAFNYIDPATGDWNQDPELLNKLNEKIFEICSITEIAEDPNKVDLILTSSQFAAEVYGRDFVEHYARRLGIRDPSKVTTIGFLISTTMNPWTTDTPQGDFLEVVESTLCRAVHGAIDIVTEWEKHL
jgi:hypothetical protein